MKILLVSSSSGSRGGGEFYLHSLSQGLTELGHEVITLMSSSEHMNELAEQFTTSSLPVLRIPYRNTYQRKLRSLGAAWATREIRQLQNILIAQNADVIHLNQQCVEDGLDLLQAACQSGLPTVSTVHVTRSMTELGAAAGQLRDWAARRLFRRCQTDLIGISQVSAVDLAQFINGSAQLAIPQQQMLSSSRKVFGEKCSVYAVPNGVSVPGALAREQLRNSWGIPEHSIVLGCVARIEEQKNPLFLVPLMKRLPEQVHFVWIGDGRQKNALESAVKNAHLENRFHLPGWQANASAQMSGFDVFVLPSLYEGLPLALLEAMALGIPPVASAVDGIQDAIETQVSGFFCPVNDEEAWLETLMALCNSETKRQQIGAAAQQRHRQHFSLEAMAQRTVAVYAEVIRKFALRSEQNAIGAVNP